MIILNNDNYLFFNKYKKNGRLFGRIGFFLFEKKYIYKFLCHDI